MRIWTRVAMIAAVPALGLGGLAVLQGNAFSQSKQGPAVLTAAEAQSKQAGVCWYGSSSEATLAKKLSNDIQAAARQAAGSISVSVYDRTRGISCFVNSHKRYDSASTVKATILAALLRKRGGPSGLSSYEKSQAKLMITQSDNNAASYLWGQVGPTSFQHFLNLAGMSQTVPGPGGYWGLTQETAYDELKLLKTLTASNSVLSDRSRAYELSLMNQVVSWQRWGTPAGTPSGITWHVKNGWLPRSTHQWRVHSIGSFNGRGNDYMMAILTQDDSTMQAGIDSIERVARVVHRDLNPGHTMAERSAVVPREQIPQTPDELIPNLPNIP